MFERIVALGESSTEHDSVPDLLPMTRMHAVHIHAVHRHLIHQVLVYSTSSNIPGTRYVPGSDGGEDARDEGKESSTRFRRGLPLAVVMAPSR